MPGPLPCRPDYLPVYFFGCFFLRSVFTGRDGMYAIGGNGAGTGGGGVGWVGRAFIL